MPPLLRHHSRVGTQQTFNKLSRYFGYNRWLSSKNRYQKHCIIKLKNDCNVASGSSVNSRHLAEYIAASAPLHCMDAWNLLGKAIISHTLGDGTTSKHFAYYAELRAVISLLASEGIGVFDRKHFEVDACFSTKGPLNGSTHTFAYQAFKEWSSLPDSGDLIGDIIRPEGIPLNDWFRNISPTSPIKWIAEKWLSQWGYDLELLTRDQEARNEASYRPEGFNLNKNLSLSQGRALIENFWRMCTPIKNHGFQLDLYLLRNSLRQYYKGLNKRLTKANIEPLLEKIGFSVTDKKRLSDVLMKDPDRDDPLILKESNPGRGNFYDPNYNIQMICRATLLLRIATGASTKLFEEARIGKNDIEFWWKTLGENHGLWQPTETDPLGTMWSDIEEALNHIISNVSRNFYDWRLSYSSEILTLSGCERIGLSGMCL